MNERMAKTTFMSFAVAGIIAAALMMMLFAVAASPEFVEYS